MLFAIAVVVPLILAVYFAARFLLAQKALKNVQTELEDIRCHPDANRILRLDVPDAALEKLLAEINLFIKVRQEERIGAEQKEKNLRRQIENISHDLRTPLTSISGYLALIDGKKLSDEDQEALQVIRRKAESLQHLIGEFYNISRLEAGDYQLQLSKTDVADTLRETLLGFYQVLEGRALKMDVQIPEHPVYAVLDESALERIISNLLQNVARYAGTFLKVSLVSDEKMVRIVFENDMKDERSDILSEEDIGRVFERFFMKSNARNQESSGLGLTIARYLAENMGGDISVELKGHSLSFLIRFPIVS